jgi:hypothetical protein
MVEVADKSSIAEVSSFGCLHENELNRERCLLGLLQFLPVDSSLVV